MLREKEGYECPCPVCKKKFYGIPKIPSELVKLRVLECVEERCIVTPIKKIAIYYHDLKNNENGYS